MAVRPPAPIRPQHVAVRSRSRTAAIIGRSAVAAAVGLVVGISLGVIDAALHGVVPDLLLVPADSARTLGSTLVGALVTVAVFSLWMRTVMVGLVSSELSPRLLSAYLEDRFQEWVTYGMVAAVGAAAAITLAIPEEGTWPMLGIASTVTLGLAALTLVLVAIHHAVQSLSVSQVIRDLTDRALSMIAELPDPGDGEAPEPPPEPDVRSTVRSDKLGWVTGIDADALLGALPDGTVAHVQVEVGGFVRPGQAVALLDHEPDADEPERIHDALELRSARGPETTIGLALDQLVDVIHHAMLTDQNDAMTFQEGLQHAVVVLEALLERGLASRHRRGDRDQVVVLPPPASASEQMGRLFRRLRQGASGHFFAASATLQSMGDLHRAAREVGDEAATNALEIEATSLLELIEHHGTLTEDDRSELRTLADHLGLREDDTQRDDGPDHGDPRHESAAQHDDT